MDALQASLREKAIQNHRLESKVGEMNLRMSHNMEDLTKALAERDRFQVESKDLSSKLATVSEELQDVKAKYEVLKLSLEPPVRLQYGRVERKADEFADRS
ncbi:hypothetical protein B0H17DRAFT_340992 [Mycena rosella]|uniref:Uncharacterized protein n=1 Tax=Mycena rosella TaxID=1033263 RepID=A0AAD7DSD2_MYCRO|nr:hypothetical protein B0H17DRAFT_340992 [Mycena rosella]